MYEVTATDQHQLDWLRIVENTLVVSTHFYTASTEQRPNNTAVVAFASPSLASSSSNSSSSSSSSSSSLTAAASASSSVAAAARVVGYSEDRSSANLYSFNNTCSLLDFPEIPFRQFPCCSGEACTGDVSSRRGSLAGEKSYSPGFAVPDHRPGLWTVRRE